MEGFNSGVKGLMHNHVKLIWANWSPLSHEVIFLQNPPVVYAINSRKTLELGGMFGEVWYTIGEQLNYRWVDIAAVCCYHKYGTLLASSWTIGELILQLPVVATNMALYWGAVELQVGLCYHESKITEDKIFVRILCIQNTNELLFLKSLISSR
jgi:hypothetical protein